MESDSFHTSCLFTKNRRGPVSLNSIQAAGHRFLFPAQRLVHPTANSKSIFFPRAVCLWVLCMVLCMVCFWAVSLTLLRCACFSSWTMFSGVILDCRLTWASDSDAHQISLCCCVASCFKPTEWWTLFRLSAV